jgi:hypothetical protein
VSEVTQAEGAEGKVAPDQFAAMNTRNHVFLADMGRECRLYRRLVTLANLAER